MSKQNYASHERGSVSDIVTILFFVISVPLVGYYLYDHYKTQPDKDYQTAAEKSGKILSTEQGVFYSSTLETCVTYTVVPDMSDFSKPKTKITYLNAEKGVVYQTQTLDQYIPDYDYSSYVKSHFDSLLK